MYIKIKGNEMFKFWYRMNVIFLFIVVSVGKVFNRYF